MSDAGATYGVQFWDGSRQPRLGHRWKIGWYVIRDGKPVTRPYETEERARQALRVMLDALQAMAR